MTSTPTWWTLSVGKVNHAIDATVEDDAPMPSELALCGREGTWSPGFWLPPDDDKRECRNCASLIKARALDGERARFMIFNGK